MCAFSAAIAFAEERVQNGLPYVINEDDQEEQTAYLIPNGEAPYSGEIVVPAEVTFDGVTYKRNKCFGRILE